MPDEGSSSPKEPEAATTDAACMPVVACAACGYDLRGTSRGGQCPECGTPAIYSMPGHPAGARLRRFNWRPFLFRLLVAAVLMCIVLGLGEVKTAYYCPMCGRFEVRTRYCFFAPLTDVILVSFKGQVTFYPNPLTRFLDPAGGCSHQWMGNGDDRNGFGGYRALGRDPTFASFAADEPDFGQFMTAFLQNRADRLAEIRRRIQERDNLSGWLSDQYLEWQARQVATAPA